MPHCTALSVPFKTCTKCGLSLPATPEFFFREKRGLFGLRAGCKACYRVDSGRYRKANAAKFRERDRKRYWANRKENIERVRVYYEANRELVLERGRQWRKNNLEYTRQRARQYRQNHPEQVRVDSRRRRARKRGSGGNHTAGDIRIIYERQGGRCWWCGEDCKDDYHVDHRIPLSKGGSNGPGNLVISCPTCNLSKGTRLPHEFNGRLL